VISPTATFAYKVDNYYAPECDRGLAFDDDAINIDWKLPKDQLRLSEKDKQQLTLSETDELFDYHTNYYS